MVREQQIDAILLDFSKQASEYDQEIPQSHSAYTNPRHCEEKPQNTDCHKRSERQLKQSKQIFLHH